MDPSACRVCTVGEEPGFSIDLERPLATDETKINQCEADQGFRQVSYLRRRPMHPDRFFAFLKRRCGPLDFDETKSCHTTSMLARTSGWSLGGFCKRRQRRRGALSAGGMVGPEGSQDDTEMLRTEDNAPTMHFGSCVIVEGGGCVWFAGSDDLQGDWKFRAAEPGSAAWHMLQCGKPWPRQLLDIGSEAGSRRNELIFTLEDLSEPGLYEGALSAAESSLRAELEACLLTRAEAVKLEAADQHVLAGLQAWELHRKALGDLSPETLGRWSLVLKTLEAVTDVVGAIPGSRRAAALGDTVKRRVLTLIPGFPKGPGHDDQAGELN